MGHPLMTAGDWEGSSKARGPKVTYAKVRRRKLETAETRRVKMEGRNSFLSNLFRHPLVLLSSLLYFTPPIFILPSVSGNLFADAFTYFE
jgi:hypothetical protein